MKKSRRETASRGKWKAQKKLKNKRGRDDEMEGKNNFTMLGEERRKLQRREMSEITGTVKIAKGERRGRRIIN